MNSLNSQIPIALEKLFEQGLNNETQKVFCASEFAAWFQTLQNLEFKSFYAAGEAMYDNPVFESARNSIIVWLITGTEVQYDRVRRTQYIQLMELLRLENFDTYLEFYSLYFQAVSYFFDGDLLQANTLNQKALQMAEVLDLPRGKARCLYQSAITHFDMEQAAEGFYFINECLSLCASLKLARTREKALIEYHSQKNNPYLKTDPLENKMDLLKMHIEDKNVKAARKCLVQAEMMRRQLRFKKAKYSLYFYRLQINMLQKKEGQVNRSLRKINDPILLSRLFDFMTENEISLTALQNTQNKMLKFRLNQYTLSENGEASRPILSPVFVQKVENEDVRALLKLLSESNEPLSKELIVEKLFNYTYDPVMHDQRIYKLILRARKELNSDLIMNHYGKYSLNLKKYKIVI